MHALGRVATLLAVQSGAQSLRENEHELHCRRTTIIDKSLDAPGRAGYSKNMLRGAFGMTVVASALVGVLGGAGGFTFITAKGTAYLSDDPEVCVSCHIMREQYDGWSHGSHHAVAVCNDCHLPRESLVGKLYVKALNGWNHSKAFTLQNFPEPIRIKPDNAVVLEQNCLRCHTPLVDNLTAHGTLGVPTDPTWKADLYGCVRCHQSVGHGPTR